MAIDSTKSLFEALVRATRNEEVRGILEEIGDSSEATLDVPFGRFKFHWHAFGNNPSNISTIGLGTKPGRSLTERVTNAIDALLEDRVQVAVAPPTSPRLAAKAWFNRPISGPDDGLFKWDYSAFGIDRRISVVMLPSGNEFAPTVDVVDEGIGIRPEDFFSTILSLQSGNKITKRYLIGAFGQGGAATLAFCDYALILSRHRHDPANCGFTVVRVLNLNETYKEDCYAYLALRNAQGSIIVPSCEIGSDAIELYTGIDSAKVPRFSKGTVVRHYSYKLTNLAGKLGPGTGNLYHHLHSTLFDPLFPFRVFDFRDPRSAREELVRGSRNRLMRLQQEGETESRTEVKHYRPMEYVTPLGALDATVGIEYWVVINQKKVKGDYVLRAQSHELFVETGYPIVGTLNGQNQGQINGRMLKEVGLGMVGRHIVIHLDATNASNRVRRELFSTSREGFKDGPVLEDLIRVLRHMLEEDENLFAIERELTERIAKREAETTSEEVRRQVTSLLAEAGLQVREEGPSFGEGGKEKQAIRRPRKRRYRTAEPLPTLPFPQVMRFEIVAPSEVLQCAINDNELILVETDADAEFDRQGRLAIRCEPPLLEQASKAPLRGGRVRWRFRPKAEAKAGETGLITAAITRIDGSQITDQIRFEILPAMEEAAKREKGFVPPFKIVPINPYDNAEEWASVWPNLDDTSSSELLESVAYRPVNMAGVIHVFYSTIFPPFRDQIEKLKSQAIALSELFRTSYEVWIGYHAILQSRSDDSDEIDPDSLEKLLERDRVRVATMQSKQAAKTAELQHKALRVAVSSEA